jgi:peptide/nickel transport system substrate-binding protein
MIYPLLDDDLAGRKLGPSHGRWGIGTDTKDRAENQILAALSVLIASVLLLQAVFIVGSFGSGGDSSAQTTLRIGFLNSVDSMNPYLGINPESYVFWSLVYDPLFSVDQDLNATPDLASSAWIVPESDPSMVASGEPFGSVWQYNLTHNAYWHDGTHFSADDVVWNINLNAGGFSDLWAYQPYSYFMKSADKIDNFTVRIHFWDRATHNPIPISWGRSIPIPMLPEHLLQGFSSSYISMNWTGVFSEEQSPGMPIVGTGPFMATSTVYNDWLAGVHITLVKNPSYHGEVNGSSEVHFDKLDLRFYQDVSSMSLDLRRGVLDVAKLPPAAFDSMRKDIWLVPSTHHDLVASDGPDPTGRIEEYQFRMDASANPSTNDPVIRQALHMATNKTYIVDNFYLGLADEGSTLISPTSKYWHYEPSAAEKFKYNLAAAAQLLAANGYLDIDSDGIRECTASSPAVQMGYVTNNTKLTYEVIVRREQPESQDIALYLKSQWAQIGVFLSVTVWDDTIIPLLLQGGGIYSYYEFDQVIWWWEGDVDPNMMLFPQTRRAWGGWSDDHYSNPAFEENYNMSLQTLDSAQRKVYVDDCQRTFYNDSVYIILAYPHSTYVYGTDNFTGWGDWTAHPGRCLDAIWGANPLFFDLKPVPRPGPVIDFFLASAVLIVIVAAVVCVIAAVYLMRKRRLGSGGPPKSQ